ncbi:PTS system protein [Klebsiella pneumoniae]|nr:PTS system protein [Klebsiella pneumoniae]
MPFMIVGSFLLVFAYPPFSPDTTWGFARAWLDLAKEFEGRILTPFDMTMGIMSIYICAAISYNLGKHYEKIQSARSLYVRNAVDHGLFADCRAENQWHAAGG